MISPLTGKHTAWLERIIPVHNITRLYTNLYSITVSPYFGNAKEVHQFRCAQTGFSFYRPETATGDGAFYEALQRLPWYYGQLHWEHQQAITLLRNKPPGRLLEIGCGDGLFLKEIGKVLPWIRYEGLEINTNAAANATAQGITVHSASLFEFAERHSSEYDFVCSFQVMEHIADIRLALKASIQLLKPGGTLLISVPNNDSYLGYDYENPLNLPPHHINRWNTQSLKSLTRLFPLHLKEVWFEPLRSEHQGYARHVRYQLLHQRFESRLARWGMAGKAFNKLEYVLFPFLYLHFFHMTIVGVFRKATKF